jgi:hypothetical protein
MNDGPNKPEPEGTLELVLPDWAALDTIRRSPLPFALWTLGDQPLLFHWFDHAVNTSIERVRLHIADRPAEVRAAVREATLWPLEIECLPIRSAAAAPAGAIHADHLPDLPTTPRPTNGWELLKYHAALQARWLERLQQDPNADLISIGQHCRIHPETELIPPFFIGNHVAIGPGSRIGPGAVIGSGSLLAGANHVTRSHITPHTALGPMTALEDCLLDGSILYNLRLEARVAGLETHLADSIQNTTRHHAPSPGERLLALRLALRYRKSIRRPAADFTAHDGTTLPAARNLRDRLAWLPLVWQGRLRLFGILPRTRDQLMALPDDWREPLEHAPMGVFSYADCHNCHSVDDPEEPIHAVYQAQSPEDDVLPVMRAFVRDLSFSTSP